MKKKIIAIVVALVILISAIVVVAVVLKDKEKTPDSYYIDEEGNTQLVVTDKEGNYIITDENGNESIVTDKDKVDQIEQNKKDEEIESILNEINTDPDKIMENDDNEGLQMKDDLIEEPLETLPVETAESLAQKRLEAYKKVLATNKFTIEATVKEIGGDEIEYPITYIRSGNDAYVATAVPFEEGKVIKANMIIKDGVTYCEIPALKSYMIVDDMGIEDMASGTFDGNTIDTYTFVESGTVTLNGKKYTCDVYEVDAETIKYYYDSSDKLVRIEKIGKNDSEIMEISSIKNTADSSKIKKPSGFNITDLME